MGDASRQKPNTARAAELLREMIFSGELAPGTDHLEGHLAERLGMSRTPVREALLVLEGQGLVEVRPRKGVRVRPLSAKDMGDIYDVLTELESHAAAKAANNKPSQQALAPLAEAIEQMEQALVNSDREAWAKADETFHAELVRLGGNKHVISIVAMMSDQVRRARRLTLFERPLPTRSNADHRAVLDAIRAGDAARAHDVHYAHRTQARDMLVALLDKAAAE